VIDIIIAPLTAPQTCLPPLAGVEHPLAAQVMDVVRQNGNSPVGLWKVINGLSKARNPDHRARLRCWRLRFWGAVRELSQGQAAVSAWATDLHFGLRDHAQAKNTGSRPISTPSGGASSVPVCRELDQ